MYKVKIKDEWTPFAKRLAEQITSESARTMLLAAEHAAGEVRREIFSTFRGGRGGLARSFVATMLTSPKKRVLRSGAISDLAYAGIQDRGGTIRPKTVKNLAIPVGRRAKMTAGLWPRDWPKDALAWATTLKGQNILVEPATGVVQYLLRKQVTLKPKRYISRARKAAVPGIRQLLGDSVRIAIKKAAAK